MNKLGIVLIAGIILTCGQTEVEIHHKQAIRAIIGEAANSYDSMLSVAVGIRNRGTLNGVYGLKAEHIDREPRWVWDMARKAWYESKHNRFHTGTFWGSVIYDKKWIARMESWGYILVYQDKEHKFYIEG